MLLANAFYDVFGLSPYEVANITLQVSKNVINNSLVNENISLA